MSANKIQLTKNDESVLFTFTDSKHYLTGNGRIEVPLNSLSLVIDSSDMVTFRKAASNDIFVSAPISDFGMSKAEIEEWYAENMVGASGGGGIDPETLAELVSSAEYVSSSSTIDFKNVDGEVISTINAEPFITDGMVDNVQISGNNLVITFNVDAGKQPISIPLSSIFDPSNYYDKSATDTLLSGKVAVTDYNTYTAATNTALSGKADVSAVTAIADSLSGKQDTLLFYTEEDNTEDGTKDAMIETVIEDTENGVTKTAYVESLVNDYSPFAEIYASTEVNNSEESYQKSADVYVDSEDGLYLGYQTQDDNEQTYSEAKLEIGANGISLNVDNGEDIVSFNVTADGVDIDGDAVVTESQLIDYATVASLSGKQDTLIAGSGITISGNVISADGGSSDPNKLDVTAFTAYSAATSTAISGKANASDVVSISDYDEAQRVTATALNDLNDRKQDTLVAGSGITISGNVISADGGGGSITIDQTLDSGSTNAVANSAITDAIDAVSDALSGKVDTSAVTSSVTSGSTDVVTSGGVYEQMGGLKLRKLTQAQYDDLVTKDDNTLYIITNVVNNA